MWKCSFDLKKEIASKNVQPWMYLSIINKLSPENSWRLLYGRGVKA